MPWDESYYPPAMRNLPLGRAIRIGIAKAKEWASAADGRE